MPASGMLRPMKARLPAEIVEHTFRKALAAMRRSKLFYGHGTHNATDEAAYLISHVLEVPPGTLNEHRHRFLSGIQKRRIERLVERRITERAPAAYLTHEAWLGDYSFYVDRRVIIPRSFIAEVLHDGIGPWQRKRPRRILDLCTGSGCLAVLAAHAFPESAVDASDISPGALAVARRNIERYWLAKRIRLVQSNVFAGLHEAAYDLILSNPPYVTARSMRKLPAEYLHEPRVALSGGKDGLEIIRRILEGARAHLTAKGMLVCEIGSNRKVLEKTFPDLPFIWLETSAGSNQVFLMERAHLPS